MRRKGDVYKAHAVCVTCTTSLRGVLGLMVEFDGFDGFVWQCMRSGVHWDLMYILYTQKCIVRSANSKSCGGGNQYMVYKSTLKLSQQVNGLRCIVCALRGD